MVVRVLVSGDVEGHFDTFIKRINAVNARNGPFEILLCVGEFFGPDDESNKRVLNGDINFPITTYILGACSPCTSSYFPEKSAELTQNLTYLGKRGILNTTSGLRIGYLSGIESEVSSHYEFDKECVSQLMTSVDAQGSFVGIDILVTSIWPAQVAKYSSNQPLRNTEGSSLISRLASGLKPRYHFAGMGSHYERTPYRNHRILMEAAQHTTRFIGLAPVDNPEKGKWLYAFSVTPLREMAKADLTAQPNNTSEFPYMDLITEMALQDQAERMKVKRSAPNQYFFDMNENHNSSPEVKRQKKYGSAPQRQPQPCWFCLSNNEIQKHLLVSISQYSYLTLPKGPLVNDHLMISSIDHVSSLASASADLRDDVSKFKASLVSMFQKQNKIVVFFERNYKTQHMQINAVPLPRALIKTVRISFINAANVHKLDMIFLREKQQIWDVVSHNQPYFCVELPDGTRMFSVTTRNFPLQFAREVLAEKQLLNCRNKIDWRSCELSKSEEDDLVASVKVLFKPFDFTEEEESMEDEDAGD